VDHVVFHAASGMTLIGFYQKLKRHAVEMQLKWLYDLRVLNRSTMSHFYITVDMKNNDNPGKQFTSKSFTSPLPVPAE
jgi:hypothetical protein